MAADLAFWFLDQTPTLLGAWLISAGFDSSTGAGAGEVSDLVAAGTAASNWRAVVVKARRGTRSERAREPTALN